MNQIPDPYQGQVAGSLVDSLKHSHQFPNTEWKVDQAYMKHHVNSCRLPTCGSLKSSSTLPSSSIDFMFVLPPKLSFLQKGDLEDIFPGSTISLFPDDLTFLQPKWDCLNHEMTIQKKSD